MAESLNCAGKKAILVEPVKKHLCKNREVNLQQVTRAYKELRACLKTKTVILVPVRKPWITVHNEITIQPGNL